MRSEGGTDGARERSRLSGGALRVLASEGLVLPTGMLVAAILARDLGPGGYGVFALAISLVGIVEWGLGAFFSRATVATIGASSDPRAAGAVLRWHLVAGLGAGAALWLAATPIASAMAEPRLRFCLMLLAVEVPLVVLAAGCGAILTGRGLFSRRAAAAAVRWMARLACIGSLVALGYSLEGAVAGSVLAAAVALLFSWALAGRPLPSASSISLSGFWGMALSAFVLAVSLRLLDRVGLVALKFFGGDPVDIGWYAAAQNFATAPGVFAVAFSPLLLATLTRMMSRADIDGARALGRDALRVVVLGTPVLALMAGSAGEIVRLVYGTGFETAAQLAWPFLLAALATAVVAVTSAVLTAAGHARTMGRAAWPILPAALVGYALVVPRSGAMGAALVTCAATLLGAGLSLLSAHLLWRVAPPIASCLRAIVVAVAAYLLATLWPAPGLWWFIKVTTGVVAVAVAYVLLGELSASERHRLLQGVRRAIGMRA